MTAAVMLAGCTENERAKNFGGTMEIKLKPNEKLINVTWKDADIWVLTTDTLTGVAYLRENSSLGIWNGEITIRQ